MKPYCRVIRIFFLYAIKGIHIDGISLMGWNSRIVNKGKLTIGTKFYSDGRLVLIVDRSGVLDIGKNVYMNEGCMISCKSHIEIGDNCKFGPGVQIFDNDHQYDVVNGVSEKHTYASVSIGAGTWVGANVTILKGTTIGDHVVIGAGCVVKTNIPAGCVVTSDRNLNIRQMKN